MSQTTQRWNALLYWRKVCLWGPDLTLVNFWSLKSISCKHVVNVNLGDTSIIIPFFFHSRCWHYHLKPLSCIYATCDICFSWWHNLQSFIANGQKLILLAGGNLNEDYYVFLPSPKRCSFLIISNSGTSAECILIVCFWCQLDSSWVHWL